MQRPLLDQIALHLAAFFFSFTFRVRFRFQFHFHFELSVSASVPASAFMTANQFAVGCRPTAVGRVSGHHRTWNGRRPRMGRGISPTSLKVIRVVGQPPVPLVACRLLAGYRGHNRAPIWRWPSWSLGHLATWPSCRLNGI